jgi:hypothetical protein
MCMMCITSTSRNFKTKSCYLALASHLKASEPMSVKSLSDAISKRKGKLM